MSVFEVERRLRFGDCDPSGIAYFPSYFDLLVGVTEDLFIAIGWDWKRLAEELGVATPTVRLDATFTAPGVQGDRLHFRCEIARIGRSSLDLHHAVSAAGPLWRAEQRLVATHIATRRACPWPDAVRATLLHRQESQDA